jgi:ketosteroid isomerase-like protein
MRKAMMSRRMMLEAGVCAVAALASVPRVAHASAETGLNPGNETSIRKYYAAWEKTDWSPLDSLLTDDFTFTSAAGDDHISKSVYKKVCWDSQNGHIDRFDLQRIIGSADEAFVMYVCTTKNGKSFRNVEYLRLRDKKVAAVECYFGSAAAGYPTEANKGKG